MYDAFCSPGAANSRLHVCLSKRTFLIESQHKLDRFGSSVCRQPSGKLSAKAHEEKSLQVKLMRKSHFKHKGVRAIHGDPGCHERIGTQGYKPLYLVHRVLIGWALGRRSQPGAPARGGHNLRPLQ